MAAILVMSGMLIGMVFMMIMRMDWSCLVDDCVESVVLVGGVVNGANGTVRFDERVLS